MGHVKGHTVKVPTYEVEDTEVKKSFFNSFKEKLKKIKIKRKPLEFTGPKEIEIKVFNKGGKVGN